MLKLETGPLLAARSVLALHRLRVSLQHGWLPWGFGTPLEWFSEACRKIRTFQSPLLLSSLLLQSADYWKNGRLGRTGNGKRDGMSYLALWPRVASDSRLESPESLRSRSWVMVLLKTVCGDSIPIPSLRLCRPWIPMLCSCHRREVLIHYAEYAGRYGVRS